MVSNCRLIIERRLVGMQEGQSLSTHLADFHISGLMLERNAALNIWAWGAAIRYEQSRGGCGRSLSAFSGFLTSVLHKTSDVKYPNSAEHRAKGITVNKCFMALSFIQTWELTEKLLKPTCKDSDRECDTGNGWHMSHWILEIYLRGGSVSKENNTQTLNGAAIKLQLTFQPKLVRCR